MACNFLSHWLPCFGGHVDNPNGNGNMFELLFRFRFRWLTRCFGDDPESPETSIQAAYGGNKFSGYYWERTLGRHFYGQYSMAVAQANLPPEDRSQLVSGSLKEGIDGPRGVFVGIYDGHAGENCSQFVLDNIFKNFKSAMESHDAVNIQVIQEAYRKTEVAFVDHVRQNWQSQPQLALVGSCCLVGVVLRNVLYVANAGDSRAVVAKWPNGGDLDDMQVIQLSDDYTANALARRTEVLLEHPNRTELFRQGRKGGWYIRGDLQATRVIGSVYMKHNEFNRAPLQRRYRHPQPIAQPIVKAEPTIETYPICPDDKFVIFASKGLWDEMDNVEAAQFVRDNARDGAAARLLRRALDKAARKRHKEYYDLRYVKPAEKRRYHDDISIVILFFDNLEALAPPPPPPQADPLIPVHNLEAQGPASPQANPTIPDDNLEAAAAPPPVE